ncbi:helix-turn-helix transcriptional regulator [Mycolicibacter sinensis]|jgi:AraC-like DNA-binding protein|uniref:AraC family transcriptional regulator n=1 Tax=Mycolicibacter sinensis (strain JDM601) TaxID=875328 RepID=A0A1A2EKA6_MYCSD|nr:AraC family transcriptional regulator [Mycolicibacter sinensis]OBG05587.1 AraC family transcriptional regulator [Mycolicibacter sinensis]OBG07147.1 AraC family transcriptional regulator [Mycolicibacter sinensis]
MQYAAREVRQRGGVRVYEYSPDPHIPPVLLARAGRAALSEQGQIHNFPALWFDRRTRVAYVIAMGVIIDPGQVECTEDGIAVFFNSTALGDDGGSPWLTWQSHPLLWLFLHEHDGGLLRLDLPAERQPIINTTLESMKSELKGRDEGFREAALAHLTLLLTDLARLARGPLGAAPRGGDPLLSSVFTVIDRRYREPLSLSDVARELAVSPGYLTTAVRRSTGRTVVEWITERRMGEARRLLTDTRLPIADIAGQVGLPDPGYFTRIFRQAHGTSPSHWRNQPAAASDRR